MKAFCSTTMFVVLLILFTNGIQAQTTQTKLNQIELMKQFIGNWKCQLTKDTTINSLITSFGNSGLEGHEKSLLNGKIVAEDKSV